MNNAVKKYFYLVTEPPKNVIMSQIIEYAEFFGKSGLDFKVVFILSVKDYLKNFKLIKKTKKQIRNSLKQKPEFYIGYFSKTSTGLLMASVLMFVRLLLERNKPALVFHSRGGYSSSILERLKKVNKRITYIYDVRGDNLAEFDYMLRGNNISNEKRTRLMQKIAETEKILMDNASHMFCVSNVLKAKLTEGYNLEKQKITVVPCLADSSRFSFNQLIREKTRKELKLEDKYILIYPGGIGHWHNTDLVFGLAADILKNFQDTFLIVLTPAISAATEYAEKLLPDGKYLIKSVPRTEMPGFLMAADIGLLLREKHPLNEAASPTKFAEYMTAGLPVMISGNIGDYSSFVREHKTGIVINDLKNKTEYLKSFSEFRSSGQSYSREEISQIGCENFSKSKYLPMMKQIYTSIAE